MPDMDTMMPNVNAAAVTNIPTGAAVSASNGPDVTAKGVPNIYGKELGISFDDVSAQNPQRIPGQLEFGIGESTRYLSLASVEFGDGQIKIDFDFGPARIFAPMDPGISIAKYCGPADPVAFKKILGKRTIYTP